MVVGQAESLQKPAQLFENFSEFFAKTIVEAGPYLTIGGDHLRHEVITEMSNQLHTIDPAPLLDTKGAAGLLRVSKSFLDKSRVTCDGPPFTKVGRRVRYRLTDIHEWVEGRRHFSTSSVGAQ